MLAMNAAVDPQTLTRLLGAHCTVEPERLKRYEIPERGEAGTVSTGFLFRQQQVGR